MKLFKYKDYNDYIENQIEANKRKIRILVLSNFIQGEVF